MEDHIGPYRVHPAAMVLPEMDANAFDELRGSIDLHGQQVPIIVDGDVLIDGRHRLKACIELGIKPMTQQFDHRITATQLVFDLNVTRRDLTDDQVAQVCAALTAMIFAEKAAARKQAGISEDGAAGGRGKKRVIVIPPDDPDGENLKTNSFEGLPPQERSTVGRIAKDAKVSYHKARQAVAVQKHAPDLAEEVKRGKMQLKEASRKLRERNQTAAKPRKKKPNPARIEQSATRYLARIIGALSMEPRRELIRNLIAYLEEKCRESTSPQVLH